MSEPEERPAERVLASLTAGLAEQGTPPESLSVSTTVTFVPGTGITKSGLDVVGNVPGIDAAAFREAADQTKENCPVSKAMQGNVEMTVTRCASVALYRSSLK